MYNPYGRAYKEEKHLEVILKLEVNMLGAIIGDIVGSRFEFNNTDNYNFELFTEEKALLQMIRFVLLLLRTLSTMGNTRRYVTEMV